MAGLATHQTSDPVGRLTFERLSFLICNKRVNLRRYSSFRILWSYVSPVLSDSNGLCIRIWKFSSSFLLFMVGRILLPCFMCLLLLLFSIRWCILCLVQDSNSSRLPQVRGNPGWMTGHTKAKQRQGGGLWVVWAQTGLTHFQENLKSVGGTWCTAVPWLWSCSSPQIWQHLQNCSVWTKLLSPEK